MSGSKMGRPRRHGLGRGMSELFGNPELNAADDGSLAKDVAAAAEKKRNAGKKKPANAAAKTGINAGNKTGSDSGARTSAKVGIDAGTKYDVHTDAVAGSKAGTKTEKTASASKSAENAHEAEARGEMLVKISMIRANEKQPRKNFDETSMAELVASVKQYGVLQPLIVKRDGSGYRIIAGERRFRAAKEAGLKEIPVVVRDYSSQQAAEISIIENVQRADLNPMEEAMAYQMLINDYGLRQEDVAVRVNKDRSTITNALRLLKLSPEVQEMTAAGTLSAGHARALVAVEDTAAQKKIADLVVEKGLSVRETERLIQRSGKKTQTKRAVSEEDNLFYQEYAETMQNILGTKVFIRRKDKKKGRIEIDYYSTAELERLMDLLRTIQQDKISGV